MSNQKNFGFLRIARVIWDEALNQVKANAKTIVDTLNKKETYLIQLN